MACVEIYRSAIRALPKEFDWFSLYSHSPPARPAIIFIGEVTLHDVMAGSELLAGSSLSTHSCP